MLATVLHTGRSVEKRTYPPFPGLSCGNFKNLCDFTDSVSVDIISDTYLDHTYIRP